MLASIGVRYARPGSCTATLVGDGSFGFMAGELETVARVGGNNNLILFNNLSFGWIKAEWRLNYGREYVGFATNFKPVDYVKIAEGFGLNACRVERPEDLGPALREAFSLEEFARQTGSKSVQPCEVRDAQRFTGYLVGGISPFGTKRSLPVYVEETVLGLPRLYINGGQRGFIIEMAPGELARALNPRLVHVGR